MSARRGFYAWVSTGFLVAIVSMGACGSDGADKGNDAGNGDEGHAIIDEDVGTGDALTAPKLVIEPPSVTLTPTGTLTTAKATQQFQAFFQGKPAPVSANWLVSDESVGTITQGGAFATGTVGGTIKVTARVGNLEATADVHVQLKVEESFTSLSGSDISALKAGGTTDTANFRWLYPYDKTVFPRGLNAPKLQFGGAVPTAFYVHIASKDLDYVGYYPGGSGAPRIALDASLWKTITRSAQASDPVSIEVSKFEPSGVTGPIKETWHIAQGSLLGSVYYNTYSSPLARAVNTNGAIMRMRPGSTPEVLIGRVKGTSGLTQACTVCHSVSGDGRTIAATLSFSTDPPENGNPRDSAMFSIDSNGVAKDAVTGLPKPGVLNSEGRITPFGALSFDGKWVVGNGIKPTGPSVPRLSTSDPDGFPSRLYDATTGLPVADTYFGGGTSRFALMPSFSPDGKWLTYNDRGADDSGKTLVALAVSGTPPSFSNPITLFTGATKDFPGWPAFLPDSKSVIFSRGAEFSTGGFRDASVLTNTQLRHVCGDLHWVDLASKTTTSLNVLNGYKPDGSGGIACYLPSCNIPDPDPVPGGPGSNVCNTEDAHMNYEPTVLPVAVGGYYWVVFTSRRSYGNTIFNGAGSLTSTGDAAFDNTEDSGNAKAYRKKLWVAALDVNGAPGADISHPAFYLEGQEELAGNMRGFFSFDPCKADASDCETGDECCGGFCRQVSVDGGTGHQCVPPPSGCSQEAEKCAIDADCCNAPLGGKCINRFCSSIAAPVPN